LKISENRVLRNIFRLKESEKERERGNKRTVEKCKMKYFVTCSHLSSNTETKSKWMIWVEHAALLV